MKDGFVNWSRLAFEIAPGVDLNSKIQVKQ